LAVAVFNHNNYTISRLGNCLCLCSLMTTVTDRWLSVAGQWSSYPTLTAARLQNITLNGDSAGANACMALARYLSELESCGWSDFGMVGGMVLHSVCSRE
jgi:hypothetical protein